MATMKFTVFGSTVTVTFHEPTTQEHNEFANEMSRLIMQAGETASDEKIVAYHAQMFDKWAEKVSGKLFAEAPKLTDRQKSVMLTRFMSVEVVDEKN